MLRFRTQGSAGPWIFLLHWLGGSARSWADVASIVAARGYRVAALDLPGFGDDAEQPTDLERYSVAAMAAEVTETLRCLREPDVRRATGPVDDQSWLLGGHSLGGKVAAVVAHGAMAGEAGLEGLAGMFLVSPSPAGPEPMPGNKREELLSLLGQATGDQAEDRKRARAFLKENTGKIPLSEGVGSSAEQDILRLNRAAFRHWLSEGSREDWSSRVGVLPLRALVLAGSEDGALGPEAQQEFTLPHFHAGELVTLRGAGHLAPLERPAEVALRLLDFASRVHVHAEPEPALLATTFLQLLEGPLTSPQTRTVMESRLKPGSEALRLQSFGREEFLLLQALVDCVIPDAPPNLAQRVDQTLASGTGDGWRYAALPPDREAWIQGVHSLDYAAEREHGVPFIALRNEQQHGLLKQAATGDLGKGLLGTVGLGKAATSFSASEMKQWFEEVRGLLAKLYVSDPRGMQRMGFTGFADEAGFTQIRLGETEEFER